MTKAESANFGIVTNMHKYFDKDHYTSQIPEANNVGAQEVKIIGGTFENNVGNASALTIWQLGGDDTSDPTQKSNLINLVKGVSFVGNKATNKGGAASLQANTNFFTDGQTTFDTVTFTNNSVTNDNAVGGALLVEGTTAIIQGNTTFSGNTAYQGGAIYVADGGVLQIDSTDAKIQFIGNKLATGEDVSDGAAGSDLYLGKLASGVAGKAQFTGNGLIDFQGSIAGIEDSSITSNAADVRIADAKDFKGSYTVTGGKTTIAGDKYFGGAVNVTKGELVAGKAVLLNESNLVSGDGTLTADSITIGRVAATGVTEAVSGLTVQGGVLNTKVVDVVNGAFNVSGGQVDLTTLTVGTGATADLALGSAKDDVTKVATLTNKGTVDIAKGVEVTALKNSNIVNLASGAGVGALENAKTVYVNGDATIKNLTNTKDGTVSVNSNKLTIAGDSTNEGKIFSTGANGATVATAGTLVINGGKLDNKAFINVNKIEIGEGGTLSTSLDPAAVAKTYAKFKTVDVKKGGTFDAKALNGLFVEPETPAPRETTAATTPANDALVLLGNADMNLYGGAVTVGGESLVDKNFRIKDGTVTIYSGDYKVGALAIDGVEGNALTITGGSLAVAGKVVTAATNSMLNVGEKGTLTITADGIAVKVADGKLAGEGVLETTGSGATTLLGKIANAGTLVVTGLDGTEATVAQTKHLKEAIATGNGFVDFGKIAVKTVADDVYADGVLKGALKSTVANELAGIRVDQFLNTTIGVSGAGTLTGGSFGNIQLADGATVSVDGKLELNGAAGTNNLVSDKDGKVAGLAIDNNGSLITKVANGVIGAINGGTTESGTLTVAEGALEIQGNAAVATLNVDGALTMGNNGAETPAAYNLTATTLNVTGNLNVEGTVKTTNGVVTGTAKAGAVEGAINVGDSGSAGSLVTKEVKEDSVIFADPAWDAEGVEHASEIAALTVDKSALFHAGRNAIAVVGSEDINIGYKALAKSGFEIAEVLASTAEGYKANAVESVLFVTGKSEERADGSVVYTPVTGKLLANSAIRAADITVDNNSGIGAKSLLIVDMSTFDKSGNTAVFAGQLTLNGKVYLDNVVAGDKVKLSDTAVTMADAKTFFTGDRMMKATSAAGVATIGMRTDAELLNANYDEVVGFEAAYSYFENGASLGTSSSARFNNMLWTRMGGIDAEDIGDVADDVASIVGTAGMANVTLDAIGQFNDTVAARTSILAKNGEGVNVWADVNGGKFEGKKVIDGEAGYSSDIYAGVLGVDTTVACGAKIGAALTIGTADTDSKNTSAVTSMDSDLFGLSVYTSKTFGDIWNVAADFGYMQLSNEVTEKTYGIGKFDADSDAFTFGIRGEVLTKAGALDIVPHAGLRYTRISLDQFEAGFVTDADSMNVFQMPVGVTISGELEVAGWNVAPAFDLTFTPTWGDKDVEAKIGVAGGSVTESGAMRVLDSNVVNATLGVAAQNGAWTFGLDYKLGVGSDDRMNNSFNARVNYAF